METNTNYIGAYNLEYRWNSYEVPVFVFSVFVISGQEILLEKKVIAGNIEDAKFKAGTAELLKEKGLSPSTATIVCIPIINLQSNLKGDKNGSNKPKPRKKHKVSKNS